MTPFPTAAAERKALAQAMTVVSPQLMDEINTLRQQFNTAKVVYFKGPGIEVGSPANPGWTVDNNLMLDVAAAERKANPPPPEEAAAKKVAHKRRTAINRIKR